MLNQPRYYRSVSCCCGICDKLYINEPKKTQIVDFEQAINTVDAHTSNSLEHDGLCGEFQKVLVSQAI